MMKISAKLQKKALIPQQFIKLGYICHLKLRDVTERSVLNILSYVSEMHGKTINIGGRLMDFSTPRVMGIINVTPDSFYNASRVSNKEEIARKAIEMIEDGADILDIGGYSSRPGAAEVSSDDEYSRLSHGLEAIRTVAPQALISVDTFRADVARKCVENWNVSIINDISGGTLDKAMFETVADMKVAYVLMHTRGNPATMSGLTDYNDVTADVISDLAFKADELRKAGVCDIIIDPGFGFAKTVDQNFELLAHLEEFSRMGMPLLVGMSRKSMIWKTLGVTPEESLPGTVSVHTIALMKGADILRVHDVRVAVESVNLFGRVKSSERK